MIKIKKNVLQSKMQCAINVNNKNALIYESDERDSYFQTSTGIQRHRLRVLFERGDNGNTLEQTG